MNLEAQRILDKYFSVIPVTEGVYRILIDRLYPVSDLIVGSHHAAVIDGGTGFGNLPSAIRKLTDKPLFIFNTHNHVDHVGANAQFGQPVYMGTEDIPDAVYGNNVDFRRKHLTGRIAQYGSIEDESFDPEEFLHRTAGELLPCDEGDVFDLGGLTLRVYNAPGHSIGSRAFYLEERKILYTGDNAYPCTLLFGYGSVKRQVYLATVDKLLEIPFEGFLGAHHLDFLTRDDLRRIRRVAEKADYATGIPFPNPIRNGEDARTCFADDDRPAEDVMQRLRQGEHTSDGEVWAMVLSSYT